ncbi:alpha/beta hydrolase [Flavisolibacter tropicus]|uniref:Esterase n=1 Tax=Flavisolibacter tropicus TaxID=1492898 RepID=A0A172TXC4_9BACT|nr:alpha/beta hydrolase-fold protein [Flavisolibacter tropicus]ANE51656.1 esterase [Flavisolibacter tropicus]
MKHLLLFSCLMTTLFVSAQLSIPSSGIIKRHENVTSKYVTARHVDVWLPADYTPSKKYAVLYMHDGQMLFDSSTTWNKQEWGVDESLSVLLKQKKIQPCIVVGIWNSGAGRFADYFPQQAFESLSQPQQDSIYNGVNSKALFNGQKINSDNYLKFLVNELKPFIDSTYSTYKDRQHTFIAGSSMGGLISLYAICEYPQVFGAAACLSTHWPGLFTVEGNPIPQAFFNYMKKQLPNPATHKLYFDYGDQTLDALYPPLQQQADKIVKAKGYTKKNWTTKYFPGENHSEAAWKKRLQIPLAFMLGK